MHLEEKTRSGMKISELGRSDSDLKLARITVNHIINQQSSIKRVLVVVSAETDLNLTSVLRS